MNGELTNAACIHSYEYDFHPFAISGSLFLRPKRFVVAV